MPASGNRLDALLETSEPAALGPVSRVGTQSIGDLDRALTPIFEAAGYPGQKLALIRALLYLWHDHMDASHGICQDIPTPDGSFVHGILHRREPDYGNAKYWFHRVGTHPAFGDIARRAAALPASDAERALLARFAPNGIWDAFAFIDCCQLESKPGAGHAAFLQRVQQAEFAALLDFLAGSS